MFRVNHRHCLRQPQEDIAAVAGTLRRGHLLAKSDEILNRHKRPQSALCHNVLGWQQEIPLALLLGEQTDAVTPAGYVHGYAQHSRSSS